jgi:hypothetical protein
MFGMKKKDYNRTWNHVFAKRSQEDERGKGTVCKNLIFRRKLNSKYFATISGVSRPKLRKIPPIQGKLFLAGEDKSRYSVTIKTPIYKIYSL